MARTSDARKPDFQDTFNDFMAEPRGAGRARAALDARRGLYRRSGAALEVRRCRDRARLLTRRLELLADVDRRLRAACDGASLYWNRELLEPVLDWLSARDGNG